MPPTHTASADSIEIAQKTDNPPSGEKKERFDAEIRQVIEHYKIKHPRYARKVHSRLKEWPLVRDRLSRDGFTVAELCMAIDGCHVTPFNLGLDPKTNGKQYLSLELIVRDAKHVTDFIESYEKYARKKATAPPPIDIEPEEPPKTDEEIAAEKEEARKAMEEIRRKLRIQPEEVFDELMPPQKIERERVAMPHGAHDPPAQGMRGILKAITGGSG